MSSENAAGEESDLEDEYVVLDIKHVSNLGGITLPPLELENITAKEPRLIVGDYTYEGRSEPAFGTYAVFENQNQEAVPRLVGLAHRTIVFDVARRTNNDEPKQKTRKRRRDAV
mmetsp:Transcript_5807/g.6696  ORF Transcript_5807/g.6696 Transcript_5807/m.6696 type:complete len:114 (+) Transcript_5807:198-539(+)